MSAEREVQSTERRAPRAWRGEHSIQSHISTKTEDRADGRFIQRTVDNNLSTGNRNQIANQEYSGGRKGRRTLDENRNRTGGPGEGGYLVGESSDLDSGVH